MHFGVAMDMLLLSGGLFLLALLIFVLPVTLGQLPSFSFTGIVVSLWNIASLVAVAGMLWTVVFLPPNLLNRRWVKTWLILLLGFQAIFILLPDREALVMVAKFFMPGWIAMAIFIGLLHIESQMAKSDGLALAESLPKRSVKERLKIGLGKLFTSAVFLFALLLFVASGIFLVESVGSQLAIRSWPVAQAELIRCETIDGSNFHLEYSFEVKGASYSGGDYGIISDKTTTMSFNNAKQVVEQIKSTEALPVVYNPEIHLKISSPGC